MRRIPSFLEKDSKGNIRNKLVLQELINDVEQAILQETEVKIDLKTMSDNEFSDFKRDFVPPFNLLKAPLYRIAVVGTQNAVYLLLDFHHIIFDGSSFRYF